MRIQLSVQRNRLPNAEVLWSINEQETNAPTYTISRFLAQVDEIIPLESDEWGLEDYVVQVDGFECLHFQPLLDILRDGDQVTIRPLETPEIRARNISGRMQISGGGQHLVDGVPFGRPHLRRADRPQIQIPPRKRRRVTSDELDIPLLPNGEVAGQFLLTGGGGSGRGGGVEDIADEDELEKEQPERKRAKVGKNVRFGALAEDGDGDDEDEDDEDFDPEDIEDDSDDGASSESESEASSTDPSSSDTSSDSSSESESENDSDSKLGKSTKNEISKKQDASTIVKEKKLGKSESRSINDQSNAIAAEQIVKQPNDDTSKYVPPGQGKSSTRDRNRRKRDAAKLEKLKKSGILPKGTTIAAYREWLLKANSQYHQASHDDSSFADDPWQAQSSKLEQDHDIDGQIATTNGTNKTKAKSTTPPPHENAAAAAAATAAAAAAAEFQGLRQKLLESLEEGGVDVDTLEIPEMTSATPVHPVDKETEASAEKPESEITPRRARLDIAGTRRFLFGALGVRTPKTKAEEEETKEKLMSLAYQRKVVPQSRVLAEANQLHLPPESDAWKSRIRLSAVECIDEGVMLSPPPYPFQQRWHKRKSAGSYQNGTPAKAYQSGMSAKKRKRISKMRRAIHEDESGWHDEGHSSYLEANFSTPLNYDEGDSLLIETPGSQVDYEARSQLLYEAGSSSRADDLPTLPADIDSLPNAKQTDLVSGAVVTFKQLEVSQDTDWAPAISGLRTARVIEVADNGDIEVQLAMRDRIRQENDDYNGGKRRWNRLGIVAEDGGEDEGFRTVSFEDLITPKVVVAAERGTR